MDALQKLSSSLNGVETFSAGMGHFPVAGAARYSNDWMAPRYTPCFHLHQGTDIFAARGTPVRAPVDGVVNFTEEAVGGKSVYVREANGTFYYLAHLDGFARIRAGSRVSQGQVVGFVGSTGNADGGAPHVHLQVHPRGGGPINPKPLLDRWLDEAAAGVPKLAASLGSPRPPWKLPTSPDGSAVDHQPDAWTEARNAARAFLLPLTPRPLVLLIDS
ncbi:MAG: M23 family metallopeptidase [Acidimicrobiales bacterium]